MRGFSIIETMVVILVFTIVLGAVFGLIMSFYRNYGYVLAQAQAVEEARIGIETMIKEIREARPGDDGSFPIEFAGDKEFIFYSDIDKDGETEKVRYFLGSAGSGSATQDCVTFSKGGVCNLSFSGFLSGILESAEIRVSVEGDFGWDNREYAEVFADSTFLGEVCRQGCTDCAGAWQGVATFDITDQAGDDFIAFTIDATSDVDPLCDWGEANHSMKALFEFSFREMLPAGEGYFRKGITDPVGSPIEYPEGEERVVNLSSYVRNTPPIFEYFDKNGQKILEYPARLKDTTLMKVLLIVDVNPQKEPLAFELESWVQLRNLKQE